MVASHRHDPSLNGLSMKQVAARLQGSESADAQLEAARQMMLNGGAAMVYHSSDADVERIMRHPLTGFASDSGVLVAGEGSPHPRLWQYGSRARRISSASAKSSPRSSRKMTSLPAEHFRFARRGRLEPGYAADVVIFDPSSVRDAATFERPHALYRHPVRVGERRRGGSRRAAHRGEAGPRSEARHAVTSNLIPNS